MRKAYWGLPILFLPACVPLRADDVTITSITATQTQIVVQYAATSFAPCTISVTDKGSGINPPPDVDPALFSNANLDLGRTTAAGYRWPTIVGNDGLIRTVVLGGHDEIKQALDGKWYSTALQVATNHSIKIACNGGADTVVVEQSTQNIPLGSTYPEAPIPTPGSPLGGLPQPTIDWADRTKKYIDPITGVLMMRMTGPTDNFDDTNPFGGGLLTPVFDLNGVWTNPDRFVTNQASGTLASTSTPNAPLFAAITFAPPGNESFTDFLLTPYGNASSNSVVSEWCLSTDSGQTCANFTPPNTTTCPTTLVAPAYGCQVAFSTTARCQPTGTCKSSILPSSTPSNNFSGWGGMKVAFGTWDLTNTCMNSGGSNGCQAATVSASGSTVTVDQSNIYPGFNVDRVAGSKLRLTGCSSGSDTTLTVSAVNFTNQITVQESGLKLQHCSYQDFSVGVRVILKNSGTLNVSFQMRPDQGAGGWAVRDYQSSENGAYYQCARSKVTDIQTDCDGNTRNPPLSGYLCSASNNNIYLLQDNGRICLQGNGYRLSGSPPLHIATLFRAIDNKTFYGTDVQQPPHLWKIQHVASNYTEFLEDPQHTGTDRFSYTDITNQNPITPQIMSAGGPVAYALSTGLFKPMGIQGIYDDADGNAVIQWLSTWGQGNAATGLLAWSDASTNTLKNTLALFGGYPFSNAVYHSSGNAGAGYSSIGAYGPQGGLWFADPSVQVGGPFVSNVTAVHQQGSTWHNWPITVTAISAGSPAVMTAAANDVVPLQPAIASYYGILTTCSGATGNWTAVNGTFFAKQATAGVGVSVDTFSLYRDPQLTQPVSTVGASGGIGSPVCVFAPPLYSIHIAGVTNVGGNARMAADLSDNGYRQRYPSGQLVMRDGDPITIVQTYLDQTAQYYVKVTGVPAGYFDVYEDAALTTPATYGPPDNLSNAANNNGWYAVYAETCPDPATITLPGPMYTDTGFGTTGAGNQKVRCVTIRLANEPESDFPYDRGAHEEHNAYPPPASSSEYTNVKKSMLHQLNVGDAFGATFDEPGQSHELMYVLKIDRSAGENQIDVTLMRNYGDDPGFGWLGATNNSRTDSYSLQKAIGWAAWQKSAVPLALVSMSSPTQYAVPPSSSAHFDLVSGITPSTITTAQPYFPGPPDDIIDATITQFQYPNPSTHNSVPVWSTGTSYPSTPTQSYPSKRTVSGQAAPSEMVWKADWMALNTSYGSGQNNGDLLGWSRTITNIRGTTYDAGNTTTQVWKITPIGSINIKLAPVIMQNLPHTYYADNSRQSSLITDSDAGKFCIAYNAGECRPNSAAGDIFFAGTGFFQYDQCRANDITLGAPCVFGLSPGAGWAVQVRQTPIDINATGVRRLTQGFWLPPNHYSFSNWTMSPDGKWGFFANNPIQQRPRKGLYEGTHWFVMKLPPFPDLPTSPSADRTTFLAYPVQVFGASGDSIRVSFGYGENGDAGKFYCTTRLETCWTSDTATPANPYVFDGEPQSRTNCNLACTVQVPAIPGRVLYYRVEHSDGTTDPMYAVAIP